VSLLDDAVDDLYALELDRFIPRRTELAKAAKAAGDKEAATAIGALRKPTQSAFTINRLARTDAGAIDALVDLGTELQHAQTAGDGKALRELNTRRRQLLERLTRQAFDIIGQQSPTAGQREEVNATLTAALADTGVADQLRQGILVRAAESSGFGFSPPELTLIRSPRPPGDRDGGATPQRPADVPSDDDPTEVPPARTRRAGAGKAAAAKADDAEKPAEAGRQRAAADKAEAVRRQRDRERSAREQVVAAATAEAERADAAVQEAVARVDAAQQLITRLQRELSTARRALEEAQRQSKVAEQKQKAARAALNKARG
jgi:hypothetical protein